MSFCVICIYIWEKIVRTWGPPTLAFPNDCVTHATLVLHFDSPYMHCLSDRLFHASRYVSENVRNDHIKSTTYVIVDQSDESRTHKVRWDLAHLKCIVLSATTSFRCHILRLDCKDMDTILESDTWMEYKVWWMTAVLKSETLLRKATEKYDSL